MSEEKPNRRVETWLAAAAVIRAAAPVIKALATLLDVLKGSGPD